LLAALVAGETGLKSEDTVSSKHERALEVPNSSSEELLYTDDGFEITIRREGPFPDSYVEVSRRKVSSGWKREQPRKDNPLVVLAIFAGSAAFVSVLYYFKYRHDKNAVIREIQRRGGSVEHIKARTGLTKREWDVTYLDEQGISHSGTCCVERGWGGTVYWKNDGPLSEPSGDARLHSAIHEDGA
jgi:hypothetical protein